MAYDPFTGPHDNAEYVYQMLNDFKKEKFSLYAVSGLKKR